MLRNEENRFLKLFLIGNAAMLMSMCFLSVRHWVPKGDYHGAYQFLWDATLFLSLANCLAVGYLLISASMQSNRIKDRAALAVEREKDKPVCLKAELKDLYPFDLAPSLEEYRPENGNDFEIFVRMEIGIEGEEGTDTFDLWICTPDWIKNHYKNERYLWGRHYMIVHEYDVDLITREIERYIAGCTGPDWMTIAQRLSRIGHWEFEDYQECIH